MKSVYVVWCWETAESSLPPWIIVVFLSVFEWVDVNHPSREGTESSQIRPKYRHKRARAANAVFASSSFLVKPSVWCWLILSAEGDTKPWSRLRQRSRDSAGNLGLFLKIAGVQTGTVTPFKRSFGLNCEFRICSCFHKYTHIHHVLVDSGALIRHTHTHKQFIHKIIGWWFTSVAMTMV